MESADLIPWLLFWSRHSDHVSRYYWDRTGITGSVGHRGLQQILLLTAHCDIQAPPNGERREVQQQQLGTASQAPEQISHT